MSYKGVVAGAMVLWICMLGAYFIEKENNVKHPAFFTTWGYVFGLLSALAMRWFS